MTEIWKCSLGKLFSYSIMSLATHEKRNASVHRIIRDRIWNKFNCKRSGMKLAVYIIWKKERIHLVYLNSWKYTVFNIVSTHPEKKTKFEALKFARFTKQRFFYILNSVHFNQIPNFFLNVCKNGTEIQKKKLPDNCGTFLYSVTVTNSSSYRSVFWCLSVLQVIAHKLITENLSWRMYKQRIV